MVFYFSIHPLAAIGCLRHQQPAAPRHFLLLRRTGSSFPPRAPTISGYLRPKLRNAPALLQSTPRGGLQPPMWRLALLWAGISCSLLPSAPVHGTEAYQGAEAVGDHVGGEAGGGRGADDALGPESVEGRLRDLVDSMSRTVLPPDQRSQQVLFSAPFATFPSPSPHPSRFRLSQPPLRG
jgi:hypothetical protein